MAREYDPGDHDQDNWSDAEFRMFNDLNLPADAADDYFVQIAFDMAMFSPELDHETHEAMRQFLRERLLYDFGIDFEEAFNWDEYRLNGESDA